MKGLAQGSSPKVFSIEAKDCNFNSRGCSNRQRS